MIMRMITTMTIIMVMDIMVMTTDIAMHMATAITIMRPPISAVLSPSVFCSTPASCSSRAFTA